MKIKKTWYFVVYTANNGKEIGNTEIALFDQHFNYKKAIDCITKEFKYDNAIITFFSKLYEEE